MATQAVEVTPQDSSLMVSYMTLRQMIGWIGFFMPIAVRLGGLVLEGIRTTDSISAYYYTGMRDCFVATLVLVGVLLTCYRSPAKQDTYVAIVAGLAAIGIGVFPMSPEWAPEITARYPSVLTGVCYQNGGILGWHFRFVVIFFAASFYLVYFRFRAFTPASPTRNKMRRNKIYRLCGLLMLGSFLAIGFLAWEHQGRSIFWPESVAVASFAAAWLVKGQRVLKDHARAVQ